MDDAAELVRELKFIKALLAMNLIKDRETMAEKAVFLNKYGFSNSEIAVLLDTTSASVQVRISQAKSKATVNSKKTPPGKGIDDKQSA